MLQIVVFAQLTSTTGKTAIIWKVISLFIVAFQDLLLFQLKFFKQELIRFVMPDRNTHLSVRHATILS
jgi:hypothetical protein